mmetsp:Transcript_130148/g.324496  ORF Transcript_130148/g.324496 Transcript_130148/m.324496 type:complete len:222 (+) Transcript_130148:55-720(+)
MSTEIVPVLTVDQGRGMLSDFLEAYKASDFQLKLHLATKAAAGDPVEEIKARQELCLPIQLPILEKYGFEPSKKGLRDSIAATTALGSQYTDDMNRMHFQLQWIINPNLQEANPGFVPDAAVPLPNEVDSTVTYPLGVPEFGGKGSRWRVVGGARSGGILVRKGFDRDSKSFPYRLTTGAVVMALEELRDGRLHYQRLYGDGPDYGWVSVRAKDQLLMEPI